MLSPRESRPDDPSTESASPWLAIAIARVTRPLATIAILGIASPAIGDGLVRVGVFALDQRGLPGAEVTLDDVHCGRQVIRYTDAHGIGTFLAVSPGHYVVKATMAGFSESDAVEIRVEADATVRVALALDDGLCTPIPPPGRIATDSIGRMRRSVLSSELDRLPLRRTLSGLVSIATGR